MRFKNSLAAAVAAAVSAVVFSAAFQPVQAAPILIDNFTTAIGGTTATGNTFNVSAQTSGSVGVSGLDFRTFFGRSIQSLPPRGSRTTSVGVFNSGSGTLLLSSNGAGTASIATDAETTYNTNDPSGAVNLTTGGNDAFQIKTGAVSNNLSSMSAYVFVADNVDVYYYTLPSKLFWNSFTTYTIPFTDFPGVDFTNVSLLGVGMSPQPDSTGSSQTVAGNVAFSSSATFTEISIVPEPTHLVSVAGIGAAHGAWRLRKLRRSRTAAGDVIAG